MSILMSFIGIISFLASIIYFVGSIRTKDKNAGYISITAMLICIICVFYLAFK